ncbi:fasciclin domain-containing protein [Microcella daejeonensis]|uniref:Fasciclin domain-containing protein n=1 Tax=Microcella daejeonensis TaxID=2994971 RepID=A0A9E8SC15_9MICO|nr:fasciclin domain-containing protein [Microcella daejeonensis]WAB82117.1 fasciclin domain-containing protein [Microcella daejeonensis]
MKKHIALAGFAAAALVAGTATPALADAHEGPGTIVDVAVGASGGVGAYDANGSDYDILVGAVVALDLAGALSAPDADLTVFAPNDEAFLRLVTDLTGERPATEEEALGIVAGVEGVTEIMLYHVVPGAADVKSLIKAKSATTILGGTIGVQGVNLRDGGDLADPKIIRPAANIAASNGIIHTIDRVLQP